ncbi:hypothetical protein Cgig2_009669 [Carnegiea gigantea]|uniref:Uncharacterized protein n=1 Tax=Carnegiea gigantea TaxID=171969 RepID=A0A9Q1JIV2_9CARY|nr:hypothetical protein Cgig2_009669 [Carnegiea gigantea]
MTNASSAHFGYLVDVYCILSSHVKIVLVKPYFLPLFCPILKNRKHVQGMPMFTPSQASRLRARKSKIEEALSRPEVGSSRNRSDGSMTISKPTFTRLRWPPEIPRFSTVPTKESRTSCSPRFSITLSTIRILSSFRRSDDSLQHTGNHHYA